MGAKYNDQILLKQDSKELFSYAQYGDYGLREQIGDFHFEKWIRIIQVHPKASRHSG